MEKRFSFSRTRERSSNTGLAGFSARKEENGISNCRKIQFQTGDTEAEKKTTTPSICKYTHSSCLSKRARELGQEGIVVFLVFLSKQGIISEMKISQSSGFRLLDHAAENAILQWNFAPATENGKQIESWVKIPIKFSLYQ